MARHVVRTTSIRTLPIELVIAILQEAQYDDLLPRYKWLKSYALVCRAWSVHAQQLLFTRVALQGALHCKTFQRAIALAQARDPAHAAALQGSLRTLAMVLDHQEIYADVVMLCPNLRELHLSLYHASFRPEVLERFSQAPKIKALRVRTYRYTPLFQLLSLFPSVEYLEVDCSGVMDGILTLPSSPAPAWRLRELRYMNLRRSTDSFVSWALSGPGTGSRETLEILRVGCPSFNMSQLAEAGLAPMLRSLGTPRLQPDSDLSTLTHLEEVAIAQPHRPPPAFLTLPSGIVHIALDAMRKEECATALDNLVAYCAKSEGSLRVITYNRRCKIADVSDMLADVEMLHNFCVERGIELRLMDPPYGLYAGEHVPLEEVRAFPRPLPISHRRQMNFDGKEPPWKGKGKATLARKVVSAARKAIMGSTIPPVALARP